MAVVMISMLGSLAVCILVHRLYGGWVAAFFIFIDYQWIVLSVEGGSEPLFHVLAVCFLPGSTLRPVEPRRVAGVAQHNGPAGGSVRPAGALRPSWPGEETTGNWQPSR